MEKRINCLKLEEIQNNYKFIKRNQDQLVTEITFIRCCVERINSFKLLV